MKIKNINTIFTFITITYFTISLAIPVNDASLDLSNTDDAKANSEVFLNSDDETIIHSDPEDSDEYDDIDTPPPFKNVEENSESETEILTDAMDDGVQLPKNINLTYTAKEISDLTDKFIAYIKKFDKYLYSVADEDCSFENIVVPSANLENEVELITNNMKFLQNVSPVKEVREAAEEFVDTTDSYVYDYVMDRRIHYKMTKAIENIKSGKFSPPEDPEDMIYLEDMDKTYVNSGLNLPDDKFDEVKDIQAKISEAIFNFDSCVNEEKAGIILTREELDGMPEKFINGLTSDTKNGKKGLYVNLDAPTYHDMMVHITSSDVRKMILRTYYQRCKSNLDSIHDIIDLRIKYAKILGFKTYADYIIINEMHQDPKTVHKFLSSLRKKLNPLGQKEMKALLQLKKEEAEANNKPFDGTFSEWDIDYFSQKLKEEKYHIKDDEIKQYFPLEKVTEEMLKLNSKLYGLTFDEVENPVVWHPDVRQLEVIESDTKNYLGTIYLDLYERDGKNNSTSALNISPGFERMDGSIVTPVCSVVAHFPKPTATEPSLLLHSEVVSYFREFGNAIHQVSSGHKYVRYNGYYAKSDFNKTPSQLNENLCWEPKILRRISHHYQDSSKRLPNKLIKNLIKTRNVNSALESLRQVFFSLMDMELHNRTEVASNYDVNKTYNELHNAVVPYLTDDESWEVAVFGDLISYSNTGNYYNGLLSKAYAADMYFTKFRPNGIINRKVGMNYRRKVLSQGALKTAMEILENYLGRKPNNKAFIKSLKI